MMVPQGSSDAKVCKLQPQESGGRDQGSHSQKVAASASAIILQIQVGTVDVSYVDPLSQKVSSKDSWLQALAVALS